MMKNQALGSSLKTEPTPPSNSSGQVLLDFTIRFTDLTFGDLLGQGAYGKVFAGEWKFNKVAIKQYTAQDFSDQTRLEIRKEAMVMAMVSTQSDYLVRLRGMILEKPHYSLVMEYLPGGDLFHLLKSSESLTWPRRYQIGLDMTIGLHHLHERSVLHRDLKSLNVLLDGGGHAKLADFGLSTLKTSSASTTAGGFKGTVLWSAPELFERGQKATVFSDIYSLGMILWELASRKIPFADAATPAIAEKWAMRGDREIVPEETPKEFKQLIESCWDKEPSKRPTADKVAQSLNGLLQEHKTDEKKSSFPQVNSPSSPKSRQGESNEAEMQKLQERLRQLELEKAKEKKQRKELEKKLEFPQPLAEKKRQSVSSESLHDFSDLSPEALQSLMSGNKEKLTFGIPGSSPSLKTPLKQEQELKKLTPLPSLSGNSQPLLMPPPKPTLKPLDEKSVSQLRQLLQYVAEGEQDKAEALIQTDKNLLLYAGTVKDLSGREFKQITAFQYALWAMDWHMWTMIQKYLPKEAQAQQCQELETKGTAYGKHFSLQGLTGALQTYVDNDWGWHYKQRHVIIGVKWWEANKNYYRRMW